MVFADVAGEIVDACPCEGWSRVIFDSGALRSEMVQVRAAEHVGFADDARGNSDRVDGDVHLRVGGSEEQLFQAATIAVDLLQGAGTARV